MFQEVDLQLPPFPVKAETESSEPVNGDCCLCQAAFTAIIRPYDSSMNHTIETWLWKHLKCRYDTLLKSAEAK